MEVINTAAEPSPQQLNLRNIARREARFEDGYDSDGEIGPFNDVFEVEGPHDFDEDAVLEMAAPPTVTKAGVVEGNTKVPPPPAAGPPIHVPIEDTAFKEMMKPDLIHEVKIRGQLAQNAWKKATLMRSLLAALKDKKVVCGIIEQNKNKGIGGGKDKETPGNEVGKVFASTAKWRMLTPNEEVDEEPANDTFCLPRAPTIDERDVKYVPVKHNFDEKVDIPVFKGMVDRPL